MNKIWSWWQGKERAPEQGRSDSPQPSPQLLPAAIGQPTRLPLAISLTPCFRAPYIVDNVVIFTTIAKLALGLARVLSCECGVVTDAVVDANVGYL